MLKLLDFFLYLRVVTQVKLGISLDKDLSWGGYMQGANASGKNLPFYQSYSIWKRKEWRFCAYLSREMDGKEFSATLRQGVRLLIYFWLLSALTLSHLGGKLMLSPKIRSEKKRLATIKPTQLRKKYIITLNNIPSSIATVKRCLRSANLYGESEGMEKFDAVDRNEALDFFVKHNLTFSSPPGHERLFDVRSQMGCFASHYLLWKQCVKLNEPIMILEDDVVFQSQVPALRFEEVVFIGKFCENWERKLMAATGGTEEERFYPFYRMRGAFAYGLTPAGASKLLNVSGRMAVRAVDLFMACCNVHIVACQSQPIATDKQFSAIDRAQNVQL